MKGIQVCTNEEPSKESLIKKRFSFVQMEDHSLFLEEIITKLQKFIEKILNLEIIFSSINSTKLGKKHPWMKGVQVLHIRTIQF